MSAAISYLFPPAEEAETTAAHRPKNTKAIGDLSELEVTLALVRSGYIVSRPIGDSHRYDLIVDDGITLKKVQIKTGRLKNGVVTMRCSSSHQHRRAGPTATRSYIGQVDLIAIYCPENRKVYLVPESEFVNSCGHLRISPTSNQQRRKIRWALDFELV